MSNDRLPAVTVVIPCYRQAHFLLGCIDSVLAQGGQPEIIVVNDGSPDDTEQVAARYGTRIRYVAQTNQGLAKARNKGLELATGTYIIFLDSDDLLADGAIHAHLAAAAAAPQANVFCGAWDDFDSTGGTIGRHPAPTFEPNPLEAIAVQNVAPPVCYMFGTQTVRDAGGFDVDSRLYGHEDWALLLKLASGGEKFVRVDHCVAQYRLSDTSMSITGAQRMNQSGILLLRQYGLKWLGEHQVRGRQLRSVLAERLKGDAIHHLRSGRRMAASLSVVRSINGLLRGHQWRFVVAMPVLLLMSTERLNRRWPLCRTSSVSS
ncbi:MAG TPA: glycosyltransferase [Tepidisphaeraceae bacterium]|jgi:glycosyltransferase involved in cell wall biosynthesis